MTPTPGRLYRVWCAPLGRRDDSGPYLCRCIRQSTHPKLQHYWVFKVIQDGAAMSAIVATEREIHSELSHLEQLAREAE